MCTHVCVGARAYVHAHTLWVSLPTLFWSPLFSLVEPQLSSPLRLADHWVAGVHLPQPPDCRHHACRITWWLGSELGPQACTASSLLNHSPSLGEAILTGSYQTFFHCRQRKWRLNWILFSLLSHCLPGINSNIWGWVVLGFDLLLLVTVFCSNNEYNICFQEDEYSPVIPIGV